MSALSFDRQALVVAYEPLAKKLAQKFYKPYGHLEFDDVLSFAKIGLVSAAHRWDASRGLRFSTFASPRIVGAILDGFRAEFRRVDTENPVSFVSLEDFGAEPDLDQAARLAKVREGIKILLDPCERLAVEDKLAGVAVLETARKLGVTKSYVWQLEKRATEQLRLYVEGVPARELTARKRMGRKRKFPLGNALQ